MTETTENTRQVRAVASHSKPKWLAVFFFIASIIYLFPEAVFNAKLVALAGSPDSTPESMHLIELFGRSISGVGFTLLIADVLLKGRLAKSWFKALLSLAVITIIVWPTVFFGQKLLVDKLLIEQSSPSQRQEAFFSSLLKSSLASDAINIEGLSYNINDSENPSDMTFLTMLGGLAYANSDFLASLESQKIQILDSYIKNKANENFEEHYLRYKEVRISVQDSWKTYQEKVSGYNSLISTSQQRSDKAWESVESIIAKGYQDYQNAERNYLARAETRAQNIAQPIYDYWGDYSSCHKRYRNNDERHNSCIRKIDKRYAKLLEKNSLSYVPMTYFAKVREREKGKTSILETALTLGTSALIAGLETLAGESGEIEKSYIRMKSVSFYTTKVLALMADDFKKETGYETGISNIREFRTHPYTAQKVRRDLKAKQSIELPTSWQIDQISAFKAAVQSKVKHEADVSWQKNARMNGYDIAPNLSWSNFQKSAMIQEKIRTQMGDNYYVNPVLATWNNKEFYTNVIKPNVIRERDYWLNYIHASQAQFADGGTFEQEGKKALRSIIVPPISMAISLFLVLLTVLKLPFKFVVLLNYDKHIHPSLKRKAMNVLLSLCFIAAIFYLPIQFLSSKFTQQSSSLHELINTEDGHFSPPEILAIQWVLHTQPIIQPIGMYIDRKMGVSTQFQDKLQDDIEDFDNNYYAFLEANWSTSTSKAQYIVDENGSTLYPFTITTNAENASVRVMNIAPVYQERMPLTQGRYDVEVSAPGYKTKRIWVAHNRDSINHMVLLNRR